MSPLSPFVWRTLRSVLFWFHAPQNTLLFISAVAGDNVPPECVDQPELANCELIVYARLCSNSYYSSFCCASCARHSQKNDRFGRLGWSRGGVTNSGLGGRGDEVGGLGSCCLEDCILKNLPTLNFCICQNELKRKKAQIWAVQECIHKGTETVDAVNQESAGCEHFLFRESVCTLLH